MTIRALLVLTVLGASSAAQAAPTGSDHPVIQRSRATRAQLRAELERLRAARAAPQPVAVFARASRAEVEVRVPALKVRRPELKLAVSCPALSWSAAGSTACEVTLARGGSASSRPEGAASSGPEGSAEIPVTLD